MEDITEKYGAKPILKIENKNYKLIGLPLYNSNSINHFKQSVNQNLKVKINK